MSDKYEFQQVNQAIPLNFDRMFASSLLIRLISASLLLQFLISEIKTDKPRIESPFGAGIFDKYLNGIANTRFVQTMSPSRIEKFITHTHNTYINLMT